MVRREVASRKIARAVAWLDSVEALLDRPLDRFLDDTLGRDVAAFHLMLAIQECVDLAAHWVADAGWPPPDDAGSAFDVLADHRVIGRPTADALRAATGLRNRIAHGYSLLDHRRLHADAREGLPQLRSFLAAIARAAGL